MFSKKKPNKNYCLISENENGFNVKFFDTQEEAGKYAIKNDLSEIYIKGQVRTEIIGVTRDL